MFHLDPDDLVGRRLWRTSPDAASPRAWSAAARSLDAIAPHSPASWEESLALEAAVLDTLGMPAARPRPQHPAVARALKNISADVKNVLRRMFGLAPSDVHRAVEWLIAPT